MNINTHSAFFSRPNQVILVFQTCLSFPFMNTI